MTHVIIDGQINTPSMRERSPDAKAETYWRLHIQDRTAWTLELDLRPAVESF